MKYRVEDIDLIRDCARMTITCRMPESNPKTASALTLDPSHPPAARDRGGPGAEAVLGAHELGLRHELVQDVDLSGGVQLRLDEGFSRIERWMPEVAIGYEIRTAT